MRLLDIALSGGAMRTAMLFVILVAMLVWVGVCLWTMSIDHDLPAGIVTLIGMLIAGKTTEKFVQTKEPKK